jgi:nicotinamidase-related amidase
MAERIWDRFLTERDKAHLAARPPPLHPGFGARPAVLSVDNYRMAIGDRPVPILEAIATWPSSMGLEGWEALGHIARLFEVAREVGVPVVHANRFEAYDDPRAPENAAKRHVTLVPKSYSGTGYEFADQAAPAPGELVIRKTTPSAFHATPLARYLRKKGIDTLVVCGESVSGCVRATVMDGHFEGFCMIVVEECVYDRHEASWAMNLFDIDQKYGEVVALADVIKHLEDGAFTP